MLRKKFSFQLPWWNQRFTRKGHLKRFSKNKHIVIKCHNSPGDNGCGSYEIDLPYYGRGSTEEWLFWKDKLLKALDGQGTSMGPLWYTFTERLLTGDAKATFHQAFLLIGKLSVDNCNKVLLDMTKHTFLDAFCEQKRYLCRYLAKSRSMKLSSSINRLQESI